jgi:heme/copper-type cytochrome/quinol oxidase subunit 1
LGAKLFGTAALAIAVIAVVPVKLTDAIFDFYVHGTYIVVAARYAILWTALLCGVFAGFYYFGDRGLGLRLHSGMSLAHFLFWIFSFVVFVLEAHGLARTIRSQQDPNQSWILLAGFVAPLLGFIVGGALFLVNVAWAIVLKLKTA